MRRKSGAGRFLRRAVQWDYRRYPDFFGTGWSVPRRTNRAGVVHLAHRPNDGRTVDAVVNSDVHHEMRQDRVGSADESTTSAHTLVRLDAGVRVTRGGLVHSVTLRGENLGNKLHREATRRIKDFAPSPGRNHAL